MEKINLTKLAAIDLDRAVKSVRLEVGYERGNCLYESICMAAFLKEIGIECTFTFGEAIFFSKGGTRFVVHRDFIHNDEDCNEPPFHC